MTIPYIITAAACAWAIYQTVMNRVLVRELEAVEQVCLFADDSAGRFADTLQALRSRCFITNERGHRVKYRNASAEARAKAERIAS